MTIASPPIIAGIPDVAWQDMEFYRTFYNFSPIPMGIVQACPDDMLNVDCNVSAASYFGLPVQEVRGRTSSSMGAPLDCIREWLKVYADSLSAGAPRSFTYISPCATDQERYLCCTIYPIYTGHFAYIINDVTHIKKAELKAVQLQTKNEMIVNSLDTVVWEVDANTGRFNFVSDRSLECVGLPREEWDVYELFFDRHISPIERRYIPSLKDIPEGEFVDMTLLVNNKKSSIMGKYVRISLCKSADTFGDKMIVGTIRSMSHSYNNNHNISYNNREESNIQLKEKRRLSLEIQGEIREPLNQLLGVLQLISQSPLSQTDTQLLNICMTSSLSIQNTLDNLLSITKVKMDNVGINKNEMDVNKNEERKMMIDMREIVEEVSNRISNKGEEKGIDVITCYPQEIGSKFYGQSSIEVKEIIYSILDMSVKGCVERGGEISIGLEMDVNHQYPKVVIALPYRSDIYNHILNASEQPMDYITSGRSISTSLLLSRITLQSIGGHMTLSHSNSAIFISCHFNMIPVPMMNIEYHHVYDMTGVNIWTTFSEESTLDAYMLHQLSSWSCNITNMSPDDILNHINNTNATGDSLESSEDIATLPNIIILDDQHFHRIAGIKSDIPIVIISRYSTFKNRQLHGLNIINLFRPITATKLQHAMDKCLHKKVNTNSGVNDLSNSINNTTINGTPDSSPIDGNQIEDIDTNSDISNDNSDAHDDGEQQHENRAGKRKMEDITNSYSRNVLVLDSSDIGQKTLFLLLKQMDFTPTVTGSVQSCLEMINNSFHPYHLVLVDTSRDYECDVLEEIKRALDKNGVKRGAIFGITSPDETAEGYDMTLNKPLNGPHIRQAFEEYTHIEQDLPKL